MVQLKVCTGNGNISKRGISIPYGSIKSTLYELNLNSLLIFQFLMVQLKDNTINCYRTLCRISIPYGSIKSNFIGFASLGSAEFQFLMVQLKGPRASSISE